MLWPTHEQAPTTTHWHHHVPGGIDRDVTLPLGEVEREEWLFNAMKEYILSGEKLFNTAMINGFLRLAIRLGRL